MADLVNVPAAAFHHVLNFRIGEPGAGSWRRKLGWGLLGSLLVEYFCLSGQCDNVDAIFQGGNRWPSGVVIGACLVRVPALEYTRPMLRGPLPGNLRQVRGLLELLTSLAHSICTSGGTL